jgi:hypothetical protein
MNQAGFAAAPGMRQGFLAGYQAAKRRVDLEHSFSQEDAAKVVRIVLAVISLAADAKVHDPVIAGLLDEVVDQGRGQDHTARLLDLLLDDDPVFGEKDHIIPFENQFIDQIRHKGNP